MYSWQSYIENNIWYSIISKDELKNMSYYFKQILDTNNVSSKIIDRGNDGHMGIIFNSNNNTNSTINTKITNNNNVLEILIILSIPEMWFAERNINSAAKNSNTNDLRDLTQGRKRKFKELDTF